MKVYNTLSGKKEEFVPIKENEVKMYVCGPTVYNLIHIGNARPYVVFDTVRLYLEHRGYDVTFVQNYTDVDDKIIKKANDENVDVSVITERYIKEVEKDAKGLNVREATVHPRVTNEMPEIINMISVLIEKGFAYEVKGSVYFDTGSFKSYGKLSKRNMEELEAGARIEVDKEKKNPMDFVLWKPNKPGEPSWPSPWGNGRPGWHIECSVMAKKYLGDHIDIHAGGEDLIFPHHENEIAQSEAANGCDFAKYWLHNGFINVNNEKMSKSKGNFFTLREIAEEFPYEIIRFFILSAHYRSPLNFSRDLMEAAQNAWERIKTCVTNLAFYANEAKEESLSEAEKELLNSSKDFNVKFEAAMDDDFNTADAISVIFELVKFANVNTGENSSKAFVEALSGQIIELCGLLGLNPEGSSAGVNAEEIEALIAKRQEARKNKDWAAADSIRDQLAQQGIILEDTPSGVRWIYKG